MKKKLVGIEINNVLRDFDRVFIGSVTPENQKNFSDGFADISDLKSLAKKMGFKKTTETVFDFVNDKTEQVDVLPIKKLGDFLISNAFPIFASNENKTYRSVFSDLSQYQKNNPEFEIVLFSNEFHPLIGNTLSFLSCNPTNISNFMLALSVKDACRKFDVIITANPKIIEKAKCEVIVLDKLYNKEIKTAYKRIEKLKDLL